MVSFTLTSGLVSFMALSGMLGAAVGNVLPASSLEKRNLPEYESELIGWADIPTPHITLDDRVIAYEHNLKRRPVKIQMWCGKDGPISMIPWYNTGNGVGGEGRHWTWGQDPPKGTYSELVIDHEHEYINAVTYASCGPPGHKRICTLTVAKAARGNPKVLSSISCGVENDDEYAKSVTIWTNRFPAGIGNRAFFAFSGTMTRDRGFIALRTHWVDLADY